MKYKLIAADMDGTLLDDKKIITPRNLAAIKKAMDEFREILKVFPEEDKTKYD